MTDDFAARRAQLIAEGNRLRAKANEHDAAGRVGAAIPLWDRADEIDVRFRDLLPEVAVARCPHTGGVLRWPVDNVGLDSSFWDYRSPLRRTPRDLPGTWLAMAGAMRLAEPAEQPPFTVVPGPGTPFVVPRILDSPGVRAVIAEVGIGPHVGWTISYFGPKPRGIRLINLWGTNTYPVYRDGVWTGWDRELPAVADYDFDLSPWLASGALLWIAPGDESATLREGPDECPFLDLPGDQRFTILSDAAIWHAAEIVVPDIT